VIEPRLAGVSVRPRISPAALQRIARVGRCGDQVRPSKESPSTRGTQPCALPMSAMGRVRMRLHMELRTVARGGLEPKPRCTPASATCDAPVRHGRLTLWIVGRESRRLQGRLSSAMVLRDPPRPSRGHRSRPSSSVRSSIGNSGAPNFHFAMVVFMHAFPHVRFGSRGRRRSNHNLNERILG
jgi:hypothetical protein